MQCPTCKEVRLSAEFPSRAGEDCKHASFWCLECIVSHIMKTNKCPECQAGMSQQDKDALTIKLSVLSQEEQFPSPQAASLDVPINKLRPESPLTFTSAFGLLSKKNSKTPKLDDTAIGIIHISLLDGENCTSVISALTTVESIQSHIAKFLHVPAVLQKLIFEGTVVQPINSIGKQMTLSDFGIKHGSRILCMRLLYTINRTSNLDHVVFHLAWGYPKAGRDYLDGSCLVYENSKFLFAINFGYRKDPVTNDALWHSGDMMYAKDGKQILNVSLCRLPKNITHLFFALSSFTSNNLSAFVNPSITLCRAKNSNSTTEPLVSYSLKHAGNKKAAIMCCLIRSPTDDSWSVIALGKPSEGDVSNYTRMNATIHELFAGGMFNA